MLRSNGRLRFGAGLVVAAWAASATVAHAGGFAIFEAGAKATALSGAFVAVADDPSAMFYNPAGNAKNEKLTSMAGVTLIFFNSKLDAGLDPYPGATYSEKQASQIFFPPNFYVVAPVSKGFNVSLGAWSPFGLSTKWENPDTFAGRFLSQRVDLRHFALGLQASYQVTDWLAIGAGPELRLSDVKLQRNASLFNPFTNRFVDAAHVDIKSDGFETNIAFGGGILIEPTKSFKIGAAFHTAVDGDYEGDAIFYQLGTGNAQLDAVFASRVPVNKPVPVKTTVQYPANLLFGVSYKCGDRLTFSLDGNRVFWDVFDKTVISFAAVDGKQVPDSVLPHNWKNTWTVRGGVSYQATPKFYVAGGGLYDQSPQPDEDVSPLLPDASRTGISIGAGLQLGEHTHVEFSNLFLFFHDRTTRTNKDNFNGTYKTFADLFVFNLRTSF